MNSNFGNLDRIAIVFDDDDDYTLETLTSEQEQTLGKLELDNKINENKGKRIVNCAFFYFHLFCCPAQASQESALALM